MGATGTAVRTNASVPAPAPVRPGTIIGDRLPFAVALGIYVAFIVRSAFFMGGPFWSLFDDAMISMRYGRNLAHGAGFVWNPGQARVEGYTNPLWSLFMAVLHGLGIPERFAALAVMVSGAVILLGVMLVTRAVARQLVGDDRLVTRAVTWMTAMSYPLVFWTLRGMEVGLAALALGATVFLALRWCETRQDRDLRLLAAIFVVALLIRLDMVVPVLIVAGFVLLQVDRQQRRRCAVLLGGAVVFTLAAQTALRLMYYGESVPNTYYLKVAGFTLSTRLHRGLLVLAQTARLQLLVPFALAVAGVAVVRRIDRRAALVWAVLAGQLAYTVWVGGDAWEWFGYADRYVAPVLPLLLVLAVAGARQIVGGARPVRMRLLTIAAVLALVDIDWLSGRKGFHLDSPHDGTQAMLCAFGAAIVVVLSMGARAGWLPRFKQQFAIAFLVALAVVTSSGVAWGHWAADNAYYVHDDARLARLGVALRAATRPGATIAVVGAGNIPYYSHRASIDLMGKSDRYVSHVAPRRAFLPGHNKWDYAYSIGRLRPDVIAQLWAQEPSDVAAIQTWGYERLGTELFVRTDSKLVNRTRMRRIASDPSLVTPAKEDDEP